MQTRSGESAPSAMETMRTAWFGEEPAGPGPEDVISGATDTALASLQKVIEHLGGADAGEPEQAFRAQLNGIADTILARQPVVRVALMGRTMAGKSTLFEFLTGGSGELMGEGGQRTTRSTLERPIPWLPGAVLIDTPGVGAADGEEDRLIALEAAMASDVVLWVAADDSTQEETAKALREIARLGKPLILFMNCRHSISSPARIRRLIDRPEVLLRDIEGHWRRLDSFLEPLGIHPESRVAGHALAALASESEGNDSLRRASRVDHLIDVLREQHDHLADHRVLWSTIDAARGPFAEYAPDFQSLARARSSEAGSLRRRASELGARMKRLLDEQSRATEVALRRRIDHERAWSSTVDLGKDVNEEWADLTSQLVKDLTSILSQRREELLTALKLESQEFREDWEPIAGLAAGHQFEKADLEAFGNRALRVAAVVGAAAIPLLALPGGQVSGLAAIAVSAAVGLVASSAFEEGGWADKLLPGRKKKREEFRRNLRTQSQQQLDELLEQAVGTWRQVTKHARAHADNTVADMRSAAERLEGEAAFASETSQLLVGQKQLLDTALARADLQLQGRYRLARGLQQGQLVPGVAMAVATSEEGLAEMRLFPADSGPTRLAATIAGQADWLRACDLAMAGAEPPFWVQPSEECVVVGVSAVDGAGSSPALERVATEVTGIRVRVHIDGKGH